MTFRATLKIRTQEVPFNCLPFQQREAVLFEKIIGWGRDFCFPPMERCRASQAILTSGGYGPFASLIESAVVEVTYPGGCEWPAEQAHALLPFLFTNHRYPLDV